MRIKISQKSKKILFNALQKYHSAKTLKELSTKTKTPFKTLNNWKYGKGYIPKHLTKNIKEKLPILDTKEDNWGQVKAGKKTHKIILEKYGKKEIKRRQIKGGKNSAKNKTKQKFIPDTNNPFFLEFYGALLGDGWISHFKNKNKNTYLFGFSGDLKKDEEYHKYLQTIISDQFKRKGYIRKKPGNTRELVFCHEGLFNHITKNLLFPIGKKTNLKIHKTLLQKNKFKFILRGIFDTDGSFYLDKNQPCISIQIIAPELIQQINNFLKSQKFKPIYRKEKNMITLKGKNQIEKWVKEIGMSNSRHIKRLFLWRNKSQDIFTKTIK